MWDFGAGEVSGASESTKHASKSAGGEPDKENASASVGDGGKLRSAPLQALHGDELSSAAAHSQVPAGGLATLRPPAQKSILARTMADGGKRRLLGVSSTNIAAVGDALPASMLFGQNFKVPKHCVIVDALPRNIMGKVQKNLIRAEYAELFTA